MQFLTFTIVLLSCAFYSTTANPAIEREFHRVVNSNQCLKECMKPVQESQIELSIFKRANYSDYLLNLDTVCDLITNTRHCIDNCGIQSNPFALISMNSICSEKSRNDAKLLQPCLSQLGSPVYAQCTQICGDYEQLNEQIHMVAHTAKPEDKEAIEQINGQTNNACAALKCSARCSADQFNKQCGRLENGQMAGDLIRDTVERILSTHRMDLQVFGLLEAAQKNSQPECNYLFTSEVLFDPRKDMMSRQVEKVEERTAEKVEVVPNDEQKLKKIENILQVRVFKKQLQVLNKQLEILNKQEQKMDESNEMPRFMQAPLHHPEHFENNEMF